MNDFVTIEKSLQFLALSFITRFLYLPLKMCLSLDENMFI
jgi:hypothetical protein